MSPMIETPIKSPRKLIEVALPLDKINAAAAREKSIRHGHPSTLHLWWARRPLAAARAVIFAQMVNDPGFQQGDGFRYGVNKKAAEVERERLFRIMEDLVLWENTNNEEVLERARAEIWRSWREVCDLNRNHPRAAELFNPDKLPGFHDPFAGGGALPLEAQRLGLESHASDLNPVAVTINKAMIEIPPKFAGRAPVGPEIAADKGSKKRATRDAFEDWTGAKGLAEDVRRYGAWMREQAQQRIGHLYPQIEVTADMVAERPDLAQYQGEKLTVIAWLWARTVKSPNPAFSHAEVPLASTFILSSKAGKEAYVEPVIDGDSYRFTVKTGKPPVSVKDGTKLSRGANFQCLLSDTPIEPKYIYSEAKAGRMGERLMAIVAEGARGRVYLDPTPEQATIVQQAKPGWMPEVEMPANPRWFSPPAYGLNTYGDLFTPRQLVALTTFSDLVSEAIVRMREDAMKAGMADDGLGLDQGGMGATAYAQAVGVYLALAADRMTDSHSSLVSWTNQRETLRNTFGRQALPMVWDFAEANPFSESTGNFGGSLEWVEKAINAFPAAPIGSAQQFDAQSQKISSNKLISSDPPYYDNIGYADLSDFFYVWLRRSLRSIFPSLYATLAVPKAEELVATPYRHGSKDKAETFFLDGMTAAMHNLAEQAHPAFPLTIYYAFKQSDTSSDGTSNTGWETFLAAVLKAGFALTGTWPMRTEREGRTISAGTNTLASSIVLVCRKRDPEAPTISRRQFRRELSAVLPEALDEMTQGGTNSHIAPVDLSQAIIGPGMAVFSQYSAVLEADGTPMSVGTAIQIINQYIGDDDFDKDTQFCLQWFEQFGWAEGQYGGAQTMATAKGTSPEGLQEAGVAKTGAGKFRLLQASEMPADWSPADDARLPAWEGLHQMIRALENDGEDSAAQLLGGMRNLTDRINQLAYRLYTLCERKGWTDDARHYNGLVTAWSAIELAATDTSAAVEQFDLYN